MSSPEVVSRRSDSLMRRRAQSRKTVVPSDTAATADMTGTRSGISRAESSNPWSLSGLTVAAFVERTMRAPKRESAARMLRSPWAELIETPSTVMVSVPMAPAHSQNAALDQSPSTATSPGVRNPHPSTEKRVVSDMPPASDVRSTATSTPKAFIAWMVRLMYGRLSMRP